ncbi:hypothetical protein BHE74_00034261, partial [Ensete ventricosum]
MAALGPSSCLLYRELCHREQGIHPFNGGGCSLVSVGGGGLYSSQPGGGRKRIWGGEVKMRGFWQNVSRPTSIEMEAITGTEDLDRILALSKELSQAIVIDWFVMNSHSSRSKIIQVLQLDCHSGLVKFYFVDVNKVPQALVKLGNISKMPTIQVSEALVHLLFDSV